MVSRVSVTVMRHLPTKGNMKRQYIGWTDEPIMPIEQPSFNRVDHVHVVYGSDLLRAKQSAALYFPNGTYVSDKRFRESHFGDWERKTYGQLKQDNAYRNWINNPYTFAPPNGEALDEVKSRVFAAFSEVPIHKENLVIMTHGGPLRLLLTRFSPEQKDFWSWIIPHGSMWQFKWRTVQDFKEGKRCISLSEVPITESESMSNSGSMDKK